MIILELMKRNWRGNIMPAPWTVYMLTLRSQIDCSLFFEDDMIQAYCEKHMMTSVRYDACTHWNLKLAPRNRFKSLERSRRRKAFTAALMLLHIRGSVTGMLQEIPLQWNVNSDHGSRDPPTPTYCLIVSSDTVLPSFFALCKMRAQRCIANDIVFGPCGDEHLDSDIASRTSK
ncbi:hypothetical protein MRB53_041711 [Persea americana]|nr:hypothetical protein MRB53_041711 [Persea americana]